MGWLLAIALTMVSANVAARAPHSPNSQRPQDQRRRQPRQFLVCYFLDNGEGGIFLGTSDDGFRFKPLLEPNVPILTSELGGDRLTRDPYIMFGPDRQWHMLWTSGWWDRTFGLAHSRDLIHWTQQVVPAMIEFPDVLNAWAPEMVFDRDTQKFVLYWSSTWRGRFSSTARNDGDLGPNGEPLNHRFFFTTTSDFKSFSSSKLLWDPKFNCIDLTMHHTRDGWLAFGKDETRAPVPAKCLFSATAPTPYGPFHLVNRRITGDYWAEGPTFVRLEGKTRVYFDRYTEGRWGVIESADLVNWTDVSDKLQMIPGARHGTVLLVGKDFIDRVRERLRNRR